MALLTSPQSKVINCSFLSNPVVYCVTLSYNSYPIFIWFSLKTSTTPISCAWHCTGNKGMNGKLFLSRPGWCGSVDWVLACEPKGCWFNSWSGHMPALQARSTSGGVQRISRLMFLSLSFSSPLPLYLNINK